MRRGLWIVIAILGSAILVGCTSTPGHTDAWLSYKFSANCSSDPSCKLQDTNAAARYYQGLGIADPDNYTYADWLAANGFPPDGSGDVRAVYANLSDLQIGRDMNCHQSGQRLACVVTNYGPPEEWGWGGRDASVWEPVPVGKWPDISDAVEGPFLHAPFGRVAMVYDPTISGPNQVSFYAFGTKYTFDSAGDPVPHEDYLLYDVALDQEGLKTIPRMCMACHGGTYDTGSDTVTGAVFLPFDVFAFRFPKEADYSFDAQQESLRKLNAMVAATNPNQAILDLINGLYPNGVNTPGSLASDGFVPSGWAQDPTLYSGVIRPYCRMCHLAQPAQLTALSDFQASAPMLNQLVCDKHDMPHAQVPFGVDGKKIGFWNDRVAQQDLGNFFKSQGISSCLPSD